MTAAKAYRSGVPQLLERKGRTSVLLGIMSSTDMLH